jgi:hypothetical protein
LFSRDDVAAFVNRYFEPVWESVRAVPIVRIDFGDGKVLTRTLHGNIATYVCNADGQVLDLLAGIYTPTVYLTRLQQFRLLANYVDQQGPDKRAERLHDYHKGQLTAMAKNEQPAVLVNVADMAKARIEGGIKAVLVPGDRALAVAARYAARAEPVGKPKLDSADDLATWTALVKDTEANESVRRKQVHELLASVSLVKPSAVTKRIYKDILHADLDDPYLGLGSSLFASYPFKEDKPH